MLRGKRVLKCALVPGVVLAFALSASGCATKKYVKQQIDPLTGKIAEVESISKKNTQDIRDVDSRAQAGIQSATQRADAADAKASSASQKAEAAQAAADQVAVNVKGVESKLSNLDSYKLAESTEVTFKTSRFDLNDEAKAKLDTIAIKVKDQKGYVFEVEGFTDDRGAEAFNLELSQKRADSVKRYLATTHNIPVFRISIIGVGKDKPAEDNKTRAGRARNRRVEVRLFRSSV